MQKSQEDGAEPVDQPSEQAAGGTSQMFFFPPQDGREAFACEARNQSEADTQYIAAGSKK